MNLAMLLYADISKSKLCKHKKCKKIFSFDIYIFNGADRGKNVYVGAKEDGVGYFGVIFTQKLLR